jgi:hypothetical protein
VEWGRGERTDTISVISVLVDLAARSHRKAMKTLIQVLAAVAALGASACGGDTTTGPVSIEGTFVLSTIDAKPLPRPTDPRLDGPPYFVRGTIALRADGSYQQAVTDSTHLGQVSTVVEVGRWMVVTGDSLYLTASTPGRDSGGGFVSRDGFRRIQYAREFRYTRQ